MDPSERATPENWMYPPWGGWTFNQVKDLWLPFDWEMHDGVISVRPQTTYWHDMVRDELFFVLREAWGGAPHSMRLTRRVSVGDRTLIRPDIVVSHERGPDTESLATPVRNVALVVEVVAPESRTEDRYRKPGLLAAAGLPHYWRVERGEDGLPVVHEYAGGASGWERWTEHRGTLATDGPFPVEIPLRRLVER
ncbi:Uma2 family endonuclease [Streptomyces sp. 7-21]|jgi:Uma2 family endonuclease|uniref:Uma2 family endonuclease n=1 Tax=Streptomyces sp. 7-21 TaxID=2802283 RepID=UPI001F229E95|nr:Uma2 family endonuclease [Streptomyces sp. 7-21]